MCLFGSVYLQARLALICPKVYGLQGGRVNAVSGSWADSHHIVVLKYDTKLLKVKMNKILKVMAREWIEAQ